MNYKTLVAASLFSIALTSAAFAQCTECALYPDRDVLNKGAPTPASKMMEQPGGVAAYDARAGARVAGESVRGTQRRHYRDAHASTAGGAAPADTPSRRVYMKNLHDSGYSPSGDFNGAGTMKVN
jgi:hypothetical protein